VGHRHLLRRSSGIRKDIRLRIVFLAGSLILGVGFFLGSLMHSWWQFYIFLGTVTAMGHELVGWVPNTSVIHQRFKEKRGLPMRIISSGREIGMFICIPLIQYLINRVGWCLIYRIMALFIPLAIISITVAFLRKPPQTIVPSHTYRKVVDHIIKDHLVVNEEWVSRP
jgi:MFS family permease